MYILSINDLNYSVQVYEFQVNYTCKDGYFFGSDYNQQAFTLTCFTNGTVGGADWAQCYHPSERFCFDPPAKPFNGGQVRLDSIAPISLLINEGIVSDNQNKFHMYRVTGMRRFTMDRGHHMQQWCITPVP